MGDGSEIEYQEEHLNTSVRRINFVLFAVREVRFGEKRQFWPDFRTVNVGIVVGSLYCLEGRKVIVVATVGEEWAMAPKLHIRGGHLKRSVRRLNFVLLLLGEIVIWMNDMIWKNIRTSGG
ncbi:hypothetical protein CEXT_772301 [Caerostris extrusa]|uniref:Uncharacterized protein n=1 Tax=Caerostris extrusa TaxID=172846 RepID=A0AAV4P8G8_CAEEX|nr:hypothetical protein CEXT_772301 [Caerostris extrusa]